MYESRGQIKWIGEAQTYPSGFTKREFVVTTAADRYPQDLKFEVVKEKCAVLDKFSVGEEVVVNFDIRGNEYNGKYFVNLSCWKLQAGNGEGAAGAGVAQGRGAARPGDGGGGGRVAEPSVADLRKDDDFDDDVPF